MTPLNRYFFVMWPDEQDAASSSTLSESPRSPPRTLIQFNGGSSASSDDSIENNRPVPVAHLVMSRQLQQMQSDLQESPPESARSLQHDSESMLDTTGLVAVSTSGDMMTHSECCNKCLVKDTEVRQLRKRVQALEEQLCRALGSKKPRLVPALESMIAIKPQNIPVQVRSRMEGFTIHQPTHKQREEESGSTTSLQLAKVQVVESHQLSLANKTRDVKRPDDDKIELVPGTNVFISTSRLQQILAVVKTGKQLARKLMSIYWDRATLARSTLSASSQHYEQLDPTVISAIKTYCVLFDNTSRKSEIHSTMIDKCVQARRPRRSSLKQPEHIASTSEYHEVHISPTLLVHTGEEEKTESGSTINIEEDEG